MKSVINPVQTLTLVALFFALGGLPWGAILQASQPFEKGARIFLTEEPDDKTLKNPVTQEPEEKAVEKKIAPVKVFRAPPIARPGYTKARFLAAKKFVIAQELASNIELLERISKIDEKQKLKLSVAAKGYYRKFADKWMKKNERQFRNLFNQGGEDGKDDGQEIVYKKVNEIDTATLRMVQTSRHRIYLGERGPVEDKDWQKILTRTLTKEQLTTYQEFKANKRSRFQDYQAVIAVNLLDTHLSLSEKQIQEIKALVKPEFNKFQRSPSLFDYEAYIAIYCLLKTEDELNEILTLNQQNRWNMSVTPYRATMQRIELELQEEMAELND